MSKSAISLITGTANGANIGTGEGIFLDINPVNTLRFKSIIQSGSTANIQVVSDGEHIIISGASSGANDATNIGSGNGVFSSNVSGTLQFKSISSTDPNIISVTNDANNIIISGGTGITTTITNLVEDVEDVTNLLNTDYITSGRIKSDYQPLLEPQAALTASTGLVINSGDATTDLEIENVRARLNELEGKLQKLNILQ